MPSSLGLGVCSAIYLETSFTARSVRKLKDEDIHSSILELAEELNSTQRTVAALQKSSTMIMDKLDRLL
jgi:hypothetical protein